MKSICSLVATSVILAASTTVLAQLPSDEQLIRGAPTPDTVAGDNGVRLVNPSWDQIKHAISALDGAEKTMIGISDKEGSDHYMLVAGQWDGRCLVNTTKDNLDFFSLVDPSRSSDKQLLYVGGQNGEYEERKCVPLNWAFEATEHFFETGEMKSAMNWVSDY